MATKSTEAVRNGTDADWREPGLTTGDLSGHPVPGTGGPMRWFFSGVWLVYLIQPVSELFGHAHGVAWIAGGLLITAAFCVIYLPVLMYSDEQPWLARYGLVALGLLAALACTVYGKSWTPLWIYVSAATGLALAAGPGGRRRATLGVAVVGACYGFFCWLTHTDLGTSLAVLLPVLLIGLAMMGFRMQITLMHELAQARGTVAKLAVNEERLRLARDMHDLTGQSLSMITLKSELAAKRLAKTPSSAERDAVLTELGDIGRVSRQTLHDIREAVSGYRRPTLAIEVVTARNVLEAAGIGLDDDAELTLRSGTFDPDAESVLAWCLREAVTKVMIREALAALLSFEGDIEVVAQVGRGDEVVAAARRTNPDVAVLDIEMPGMDGLTAAAELKKDNPDTKIVILTTFGRPGFLRRAMESGVSAFLVKDSPADKLTQTIRRVLAGERVIDPDLAAAALADGVNPITPRERDVLEASADGRTIAEIAAHLYLSEGTVRNYLSACIQKTGARNRAEALRIASEHGWL